MRSKNKSKKLYKKITYIYSLFISFLIAIILHCYEIRKQNVFWKFIYIII